MSARLPWWAVWSPPVVTVYASTMVLGGGGALDGLTWALLSLAAIFALVPWLVGRGGSELDAPPGEGWLAALSTAAALHAVSIAASADSLVLEVLSAGLPAILGACAVWLALTSPEPPRPLARMRWLGALLSVVAVVAAAIGALVYLAPFELFHETVVLPGALLDVPIGVYLGGLLITLALRLARGRLGASPTELAQSSLAVLGISVALIVFVAMGALVRSAAVDVGQADLARTAWLLSHTALVGGHVALARAGRGLDPSRAAPLTRAALTLALTYAILLAIGVTVWRAVSGLGPLGLSFALASFLVAAAATHRAMQALVTSLLAPDQGRLLAAIEAASAGMVGARSETELAQAVLEPLARATRSAEHGPLLLVVAPSCELSVDAAGQPRMRHAELSPALMGRLAERPGEVLLRAPLEAQVVRRPELRPLTVVLERMDALAVVALITLGELEGAIVVTRGKRRAAVTLEEISALGRLGARLSGIVATMAAERRAQDRVGAALLDARAKDERIEALTEELDELRADATALKAGAQLDRFSQPVIAYGPSMRAFVEKAERFAALDGPVLVRAEAGTAFEPIGHLLHAGSPRREGPLVVADALSLAEGRAMAALFGTSGEGDAPAHPGWLKLAQGGTLLLLDVPALPLGVQAALEAAIASRSYRPLAVGKAAGSVQALDVRVVMTSRVDLAPLSNAGAFDSELMKRLEPLTLVVPSLAARREDLRSLVLVAIDRGCRALGKPTVGIEEDALRALFDHSFREGTRELEGLIERAVGRAQGTRIRLVDLDLKVGTTRGALSDAAGAVSEGATSEADGAEGDGWVGSYTQLETRILEKALERANGNKSEAARSLGLKRTTFLDKLRRAGLERATQPPAPDPEA